MDSFLRHRCSSLFLLGLAGVRHSSIQARELGCPSENAQGVIELLSFPVCRTLCVSARPGLAGAQEGALDGGWRAGSEPPSSGSRAAGWRRLCRAGGPCFWGLFEALLLSMNTVRSSIQEHRMSFCLSRSLSTLLINTGSFQFTV